MTAIFKKPFMRAGCKTQKLFLAFLSNGRLPAGPRFMSGFCGTQGRRALLAPRIPSTLVYIALVITVPVALAQDVPAAVEGPRIQMMEASWFVDEVSTALLFVDAKEEPILQPIKDSDEIRFLDSEVVKLEEDERGCYALSVRFLPLRTGVRDFPSLAVEVDGEVLRFLPRQLLVGEPHLSESMSFIIEAKKTQVYVGEPLRLDFIWRCDLPINQMRALRLYPDLFNDSDIEVVIPRSVAPEEEQFGLPVGGRRAIAHRISGEEAFPPSLGELRFSVFVRFEESGMFEISRTRLLCSRLLVENAQSNRYAAYFNNALFEPVDRSFPHEKLHAFSNPIEIEVLPLPGKGRLESFSGLFSVDSIEVSVQPAAAEVGQLMEVRVEVNSDTCSEMLELSDLSRQASLRNRFWVGQEVNEVWKPNGRSFVARARPLSIESSAFPSLAIQIFDPNEGDYRLIRTRSVPIEISARDGISYFPVEKIHGAQYSVIGSSEGIWHNYDATIMSDVMDKLVNLLADGLWAFVLLGPILFYGLSFWVREARRRAIDESYRVRCEAFEKFKRAGFKGEDDVEALRALVAACFERRQAALTAKDVARLLNAAKGDIDLVEEIESTIGEIETRTYDPEEGEPRAEKRTGRLGERVFELFQKGLVSATLIIAMCTAEDLGAADWGQAEALFMVALESAEEGLDSETTESKFSAAALEFESCATNGVRAGLSWYNAGNAWFKAGEIGRSIASYRQAQTRMPFDEKVATSLEAARALRLDSFSDDRVSIETPIRWQKAMFSLHWLVSFGVALFWIRYRNRVWLTVSGVLFGAVIMQGLLLGWDFIAGLDEGVLIVDEVYGRKGPGYSYLSSYADPLHNGMELSLLEVRGEWLLASLEDGSDCWLPREAVQILER